MHGKSSSTATKDRGCVPNFKSRLKIQAIRRISQGKGAWRERHYSIWRQYKTPSEAVLPSKIWIWSVKKQNK